MLVVHIAGLGEHEQTGGKPGKPHNTSVLYCKAKQLNPTTSDSPIPEILVVVCVLSGGMKDHFIKNHLLYCHLCASL